MLARRGVVGFWGLHINDGWHSYNRTLTTAARLHGWQGRRGCMAAQAGKVGAVAQAVTV